MVAKFRRGSGCIPEIFKAMSLGSWHRTISTGKYWNVMPLLTMARSNCVVGRLRDVPVTGTRLSSVQSEGLTKVGTKATSGTTSRKTVEEHSRFVSKNMGVEGSGCILQCSQQNLKLLPTYVLLSPSAVPRPLAQGARKIHFYMSLAAGESPQHDCLLRKQMEFAVKTTCG